MHQPALDLFGEVPVLESDLYAWVAAVSPRWLYSERAYTNYVRGWNVADKVRWAKLRGEFEAIIARPRAAWHPRLSLDVIC